jgi:hypothetical protein
MVGVAPVREDGAKRPTMVPCHVGVLHFVDDYEPFVCVIVKAAISTRTGAFIEPRPFVARGDLPGRAYDFFPSKSLAEILVTGHAEIAMLPNGDIVPLHGVVRAPDASIVFTVTSDKAGRVPLAPPWLTVTGDGDSNLGPHPPRVDPATESWNFLPGFDYGAFNVGHARLRSERILPGSEITIEGLTETPMRIALPERSARAIVHWTRRSMPTDTRIDLDTVHVDLDEERVDLTWRGTASVPSVDPKTAVDRIVVLFPATRELDQTPSENPETRYRAVLSDLPHGQFRYATTYEDVRDGAVPPTPPVEELEMARYEALGNDEAPAPTLTLAEHAQVTAELLEIMGSRGIALPSIEEQQARADVLRKFGFDEFSWGLEERAHTDRLAAVPTDPSGGIHAEYSRLFVKAQDELAQPDEVLPSAKDYATMVVRLRVENPRDVLSDAKMSLGKWMRIDRKWQEKMIADDAAREEVEQYLDAEEDARGEPKIPEVDDEGRFV